jgi:predicted AAA+ superfamily ATPase
MKEYKNRLADSILTRKLASTGAVLIEGAKWCGKTTTAGQIAKSTLFMQDPAQKKQNIEMAEMDPSFLLSGETPRLIDEWQLAPKLWDAIRYEVDKRDEFGQFILTGSAVPGDLSEISHSGTGRISRMLMRPMSLYESGDSNGSVSLSALFSDNINVAGTNNLNLEQIAFLICRGGWPKAIGTEPDVALQLAINYFDAVVNDDISRVDGVRRDAEKTKRILRSYARSVASQAKISSITQDVYSNEDIEDLTNKKVTISSYISALKKIFVIEDSLAWNPNLRSKTAIQASDTRYFTDPSIGAAALGLGAKDLLNDLETMGLFFENLCIRDLRIYTDALDGQVYHYRDRNNLECDAVVHLRNGSYGLIEIKLGGDKRIEEGVKTLNKLEENIDTTKMKAPAFKMILTAVGNYAYRRKDGILIVPLGSLKD